MRSLFVLGRAGEEKISVTEKSEVVVIARKLSCSSALGRISVSGHDASASFSECGPKQTIRAQKSKRMQDRAAVIITHAENVSGHCCHRMVYMHYCIHQKANDLPRILFTQDQQTSKQSGEQHQSVYVMTQAMQRGFHVIPRTLFLLNDDIISRKDALGSRRDLGTVAAVRIESC
jgi:hypothetical protein